MCLLLCVPSLLSPLSLSLLEVFCLHSLTHTTQRIQRIFRGHQGRVLYLKALATHLAELATQKMHESAIKIAALTRGVLVRRM